MTWTSTVGLLFPRSPIFFYSLASFNYYIHKRLIPKRLRNAQNTKIIPTLSMILCSTSAPVAIRELLWGVCVHVYILPDYIYLALLDYI